MEEKKLKVKKLSNDVISAADSIQVKTPDQNEAATEYLQVIKRGKKVADEYFDPMVKTAYRAYKTAYNKKKEITDRFKKAERTVKDKIRKFLAAEEEKKKKLQKQVEKEAKKNGMEAPEIKDSKVEGQVKRDNWKAVVVDKSKIPLEYLEPDMKKLNAMARAKKGESNIAGIKFEKEIVVGIR